MVQQVVLRVQGMSCAGCEERIGAVMGRLAGVRNASADHRSGEVRVLHDPAQLSTQALAAQLAAAGFPPVDPDPAPGGPDGAGADR